MEKFKISDEYSNKLCDYYVEGIVLFKKYLAKHHPKLDFANLDMDAVEKEVLSDRRSAEGVGGGGETTTVDESVCVDQSSSILP